MFDIIKIMNFVPVCYSSKNYKITSQILGKMDKEIKWIYVDVDH